MSGQRPSARAPRRSSHPPARAADGPPRLTSSGLLIGARELPLWSGAVHYFRLPKERWRAALEALLELGLTMCESYVPWGTHELAPGRYDFGQHDPRKDLGAFLDLAHELGLWVFLRPGPCVNAELPYFGLPRRVTLDAAMQARSPRGNPLPLIAPPRMFATPSYASRAFRDEVAGWFRALAEVVAPRCAPKGPVALLQVDNEAAFYFRDAPGDSDHHPDALQAFAGFLAQRYGTLGELNRCYGTDHGDFAAVPAPTYPSQGTRADLLPKLDWVAFREHLICDALAEFARALAQAGLELPTVHNLPMGEGGLPTSLTAVQGAVDLACLDYYSDRDALEITARRTLRLAGATSLPFAPELGVGAPPWFAPRSDADALQSALCACAYGLRGFNLYMAVDRENWYGAPIDSDGAARPSSAPWKQLLSALREVDFHRLRRRAQVALCVPKEYAQLAQATHALGALSPNLLDLAGVPAGAASVQHRFDFAEPIQQAWQPLLARLNDALTAEQIPFVYVEGEQDLCALPDLRVVFAPSFELADPERWKTLERFAERGGRVIFGPKLPELDVRLQPRAFTAPHDATRVAVRDQAEARALVRELASELGLGRPFPTWPHPLCSTAHEDESGRTRCVFLVNPGGTELLAELHTEATLRLRDALSGECFPSPGSAAIPMAPRSCRMLLVEDAGA